MDSLVKKLAASYERRKANKWWKDMLTRDTLVDPPLTLENTDELDFDDIPTLDYNWRTI